MRGSSSYLVGKCRGIIDGWSHITYSSFNAVELFGGLTNELYTVELKHESIKVTEGTPRKVLVRLHGVGAEKLYDPADETDTFQHMSDIGIGPKLFGYFTGGRIEEFIDGPTLTVTQARQPFHLSGVARAVAKFHYSGASLTNLKRLTDKSGSDGDVPFGGGLVLRLEAWRDNCLAVIKLHPDWIGTGLDRDCFELGLEMADDIIRFSQNSIWFRSIIMSHPLLKKTSKASPHHSIEGRDTCVVEALTPLTIISNHNDLQELNILLQYECRHRLIDFEYACLGWAAYDVANFVSELEVQYIEESPGFKAISPLDPRKLNIFLECYLSQRVQEDDEQSDFFPCIELVQSWIASLPKFQMLSGLLWGFWGIMRHEPKHEDGSGFNYLKYANHRLKGVSLLANELKLYQV